MDCNASIKPH